MLIQTGKRVEQRAFSYIRVARECDGIDVSLSFDHNLLCVVSADGDHRAPDEIGRRVAAEAFLQYLYVSALYNPVIEQPPAQMRSAADGAHRREGLPAGKSDKGFIWFAP